MKKIFLFKDKDNTFSLSNKIVNKPILDYFLHTAREVKADEVYLISEEQYQGITSIDSKNLKNYINEDDQLVFISAKLPLVKGKLIQKTFHGLSLSESGVLVVEQSARDIGIYGITSSKLLPEINENEEFCIRKSIQDMKSKGLKLDVMSVKAVNQFVNVDCMSSLSEADILMRRRINKKYMKQGVFIENPDSVTIEYGVEIGKGTVVENGCRILGDTVIGEDCLIGAYSNISDSKIQDNVKIIQSYIEKSIVERYTDIGPFARLRPNAHLKEHVHIGNFVEVKNSTVGNNTKAGHLTYIGDADLGDDINIGCGVVFVNYDGKFKHRTIVDDGAFIGSNVNIVAPVHVEKEGYVAAGSTITKDVKEGYLVLERADRKDLAGYVARKKEKDALKGKK